MDKNTRTKVNFSQYRSILEAQKVDIHILLSFFKKTDMDYDKAGNILINFNKETANTPILVAHLDNVLSGEREPILDLSGNIVLGRKNGIGFDDKAGIIGAIEIWRRSKEKDFRIIFTADEEVGGIGAGELDENVYQDASYIIEMDRKGGSDLIQNSGGTRLCSDEFASMFECYGFKKAQGTFTDVNVFKPLARHVNMVNLSIGYHNPHTNQEYLDVKEFEYVVDCVFDFLQTHKEYIPDDTIDIVEETKYERFGNTVTTIEDDYGHDQCDWCGRTIWNPEDAVYTNDGIFCSEHCLKESFDWEEKLK